MLDTVKVKIDYMRERFNSNINIISLEARNILSIVVSISILKYIYGFTYYRKYDNMINNKIVKDNCLRFSK